jgi:hypothetical protein
MRHQLRAGIEILSEEPGGGAEVQRHSVYQFRLRCWLSRGEPVKWSEPWGLFRRAHLEDDGATLVTDLRVDRLWMFAGLFHGVQGMRVGGTRKLRIAPHLAYRDHGVPGVIPQNALLTVEVTVLSECDAA